MIYNLLKRLLEREERLQKRRQAARRARASPSPSPKPVPSAASSTAKRTAKTGGSVGLFGALSIRPKTAAVPKPGAREAQTDASKPAEAVSNAVEQLASDQGLSTDELPADAEDLQAPVKLNEQELAATVSQLAQMDPTVLAKWAAVEKEAVAGDNDPAARKVIAAANRLARAAAHAAAVGKPGAAAKGYASTTAGSIPATAPARAEPGSKEPRRFLKLRRMLGLA